MDFHHLLLAGFYRRTLFWPQLRKLKPPKRLQKHERSHQPPWCSAQQGAARHRSRDGRPHSAAFGWPVRRPLQGLLALLPAAATPIDHLGGGAHVASSPSASKANARGTRRSYTSRPF